MNRIRTIPTVILCICLAAAAHAQTGVGKLAPYIQLIEASHFIQNYKQMASVSATVFAARAQGSDKQFAALMAKVANADLSDFRLCLSKAYAAGPLTIADTEKLVDVFRSPGGQRVLELSQQMLISDIRRGYHKQVDPSHFTESDRRSILRIYNMPVFQQYSAFIASPTFTTAMQRCLASSRVGKENGFKF